MNRIELYIKKEELEKELKKINQEIINSIKTFSFINHDDDEPRKIYFDYTDKIVILGKDKECEVIEVTKSNGFKMVGIRRL